MKKSFGGLINKLTSSGKLDAGVLKDDMDDDEENDVHYRKTSTLDSTNDADHSEEFKFKKSFSLKGLSPFKPQETAPDSDYNFSKRKSSSMRSMPDGQKLDAKEKLHESDDKFMKKSFSLRGVPSVFSKSPESKTPEPLKSPSSLKNLFSPTQYEQHYDFNVNEESEEEESSSEGEEAQAVVPTKAGRRPRVNSTYDDFDESRPKPLAASAPVFTHQAASSPVARAPHPSSPPKLPSSPPKVPSSPPSGQVPASFASSPPRAQVTASPRLQERPPAVVTDDFEAQFGRMRSDSTASDDDMLITSNSGSPLSMFNPFSSKARKLK
jgi:hypothetical protein